MYLPPVTQYHRAFRTISLPNFVLRHRAEPVGLSSQDITGKAKINRNISQYCFGGRRHDSLCSLPEVFHEFTQLPKLLASGVLVQREANFYELSTI